jgi:hypothetical protein
MAWDYIVILDAIPMIKSQQDSLRDPQKPPLERSCFMSTALRWNRVGLALVLGVAILSAGTVSFASAASQHSKKKAKTPPLPPLPSGPTGPVQPIPLDAIAAVPPQVSYENNQLTINAPNSTLADILRAVRKQTGAEIEVPSAPERVVTRLGPGPARDVVAQLLNGSRFNYVLLGSASDNAVLTKVVLVAKTGSDTITPPPPAPEPVVGITQANNSAPPQEPPPDTVDVDQSDDNAANADDSATDQAAQEVDQQQPQNPEQPGVKTPQQMLQEMQQRQMQLQQQQPPGQPPIPGSGMPPRPPQPQ